MKNTLFTLFLLSGLNLTAQNTAPRVICGNEVFSHIVKNNYPELNEAIRNTFEATRAQSGAVAGRSGPLTINVVVHVVWKEDAENLADSIILDQIAVLNSDFNRENADTVNLRDVFVPAAGNPQIRFNLVSIERVQTDNLFEVSITGESLLSELKHSADGGSDAWNTEQYLNIWVCKIQPLSFGGVEIGQILGFAFPPAGLANWPPDANAPTPDEDGVVIDYRVFGSNNPNTVSIPGSNGNLTVKGRTPVHEVGHYLGLRHIWGDGGLFGPNDCEQSDGIDDTPYANAQSEFDCDTTRNTCPVVETFYNEDVPDLVENYMDYSNEGCQNMFTKGQAQHMANTLNGPRAGLLSNPTAVTDPSANPDWSIAPNPAADRFTVAVAGNMENETPEIRVIGANGQIITRVAASGRQTEVNTAAFGNGLYFVQLHGRNGITTRKVVIQR